MLMKQSDVFEWFNLRKDVDFVVAVYVALIVAGRRTIDNVPVKLRDAVLADLEALGLDGNGQSIEVDE